MFNCDEVFYFSIPQLYPNFSGLKNADTIVVLPVGTTKAYFKRKEKTLNVLGESSLLYHHLMHVICMS